MTQRANCAIHLKVSQMMDIVKRIILNAFHRYLYWTTALRLNWSTLSGENVENVLPHSPCIHYVAVIDYLYYFQGCGSQKNFQLLKLATFQESVI